ncbi:MAG TPA: class I SAM-dependent methyltransferase [Candidatus Diapherotrites archaeon]|uniref:Class I SAM-dependent methyltransferase n=1 Tax=Candidatus Iainarchaeum sp. TaxID=3101447 RepID=A0A7J4IXI8_9ARCH|nr:class I SAM-dependent methyltransferase [Candidatus Diapherotrites archaeon]
MDCIAGGAQDITADLNKPWKFAKDSSVEYLFIKDGLEHLDSLEHFFREVSRILLPNGRAEIWVPHYKSPSAYKMTHNFFFSWSSFNGFPEPHDPVRDLRVVSNLLVVEPNVFPFTLLNSIANLFPKYWERLFY